LDISDLLAFAVKNKASDLHLSAGLPPMIRVNGDIRKINVPAMDHSQVHDMVYDIMNDGQRKVYEEHLECDFSFEIPNVMQERQDIHANDARDTLALAHQVLGLSAIDTHHRA